MELNKRVDWPERVFQLMLICSLYLFLRSHIVVTDEGPLPFSSVT